VGVAVALLAWTQLAPQGAFASARWSVWSSSDAEPAREATQRKAPVHLAKQTIAAPSEGSELDAEEAAEEREEAVRTEVHRELAKALSPCGARNRSSELRVSYRVEFEGGNANVAYAELLKVDDQLDSPTIACLADAARGAHWRSALPGGLLYTADSFTSAEL
jgi:hypothetical protein